MIFTHLFAFLAWSFKAHSTADPLYAFPGKEEADKFLKPTLEGSI